MPYDIELGLKDELSLLPNGSIIGTYRAKVLTVLSFGKYYNKRFEAVAFHAAITFDANPHSEFHCHFLVIG